MFDETDLQARYEGWKEDAERRREELLRALDEGRVAEPVTGAIFTIAVLKGLLISTAISVGTGLLTRALTPRQKFTTGQLQGTLQVPQSDQGLPIVEGYGADPGAKGEDFRPSHDYALEDRVVRNGYFYVVTAAGTSGATAPTFTQARGAVVSSGSVTFTCYGRTGGGFRLPMVIVWTSGIRKHDQKVQSGGGGKGPKPPEQTVRTYDLDFAVMPGRGPVRVKRLRANTKTIYQTFQNPTVFYQAESSGNTKTGGAANVTDSEASGGSAVQVPTGGSLRWNNVFGDGTAVILEFHYKATEPISVQFEWTGANGTTTFNETLNASSDYAAVSYNSAPWVLIDSSVNTVKVTNLDTATVTFDFLGVRVSGGPTGVPSALIPADEDFDPELPHDPETPNLVPRARFAGELLEDVDGSLSGTVQAGAGSNIAIYPGNDTQAPDPTLQGAIDAQYGAGSTPAFRDRCLVVLTNFFLTDYGGSIPLIQALAEHLTVDTFELFCDHMSERAGVLESTDYDWSGVRRTFMRGIPVTPPYSPADVMEELARVYNVYFVETDKLRAFERGSQAPIAALTSANLGWVDGEEDEDEAGELPGLEATLETETAIARRYELTAVDPDRDFEQNHQGTSRQITRSEKTEKIELAVTLYAEEMREVTQRELYEEEVESTTYSDTLDWTYLWANPGDTITVTEDDGFAHEIFIEDIKPNVGVIPFTGRAQQLAVYSQPVSTSPGVFEIPPVPIPAMTIVGFYDGPLLRDDDNTVNNGAGVYVWAHKRRGDGDWSGAALYVDRGLGWELLETFETQATAGVAASVLTPTTSTSGFVADALTVDLHDETVTLESYTADDLLNGAGGCIVGSEVCQILSATRVGGHPARWDLVIGLRGKRGTEAAVGSHVSGERFVLIDDSIKFVPLGLGNLNTERPFKMVTSGQSLDDAATVLFAWTGQALKPLAPTHVRGARGPFGDLLIEWTRQTRIGQALRDLSGQPLAEEEERYEIEILNTAGSAVLHTIPVAAQTGRFTTPVVWQQTAQSGAGSYTVEGDGSLSCSPSSSDTVMIFRSAQRFGPEEVLLEFSADPSNDLVKDVGIGPAGDALPAVTELSFSGGLSLRLHDFVEQTAAGVEVLAFNDAAWAAQQKAAGDRFAVEYRQGRALTYKNRLDDASPPFADLAINSVVAESRAVAGQWGAAGTFAVWRAKIRTRQPATVFNRDSQAQFFGSVQSPIRVRIYQVSALVGRGAYVEAVLE